MSDTTQTPQPSVSGDATARAMADKPRRRFFISALIATLVAAVATVFGVRAFADAGYGGWHRIAHAGYGGWHRGGFMGATVDPARLDEHLDRMLRHLYVEIDATDAQKQLLAPIVKSAARDLLPVRSRIHDARRQAVELLSRPTIDRAALETLRDEQIKLMDQASKRLTEALADVADVLTPEQRRQVAERIGRWHGPHS